MYNLAVRVFAAWKQWVSVQRRRLGVFYRVKNSDEKARKSRVFDHWVRALEASRDAKAAAVVVAAVVRRTKRSVLRRWRRLHTVQRAVNWRVAKGPFLSFILPTASILTVIRAF